MATLLKRSNGIYYHITSFHGRQIWKSTGARNKAEALQVIKDNFRKKDPAITEFTISQYASRFFQYSETNYAHTTIALYRQAINTFKRIVGDFNLKAYTMMDIEHFKSQRSKEVSPVKVNIDFRTVRAFFQTAVRWKILSENPFQGIKQIKIPMKRPAYLTKEEFIKLLGVVKIGWLKYLLLFAVSTMMRIGEILALRWESVDFRRKIIIVENTKEFTVKTGKSRVVPMNEWVFKYLATREKKEGYIFSSPAGNRLRVGYVSHLFKKYARLAGLPEDIHFHSLRHTGASWLVQDGVSIYSVQKLLGHSSIATTQVYSHLEVDGLFASVEKISVGLQPQLLMEMQNSAVVDA